MSEVILCIACILFLAFIYKTIKDMFNNNEE